MAIQNFLHGRDGGGAFLTDAVDLQVLGLPFLAVGVVDGFPRGCQFGLVGFERLVVRFIDAGELAGVVLVDGADDAGVVGAEGVFRVGWCWRVICVVEVVCCWWGDLD